MLKILLILTFCRLGVTHIDVSKKEVGFCPVEAIVDLANATRNNSGLLSVSGQFFPWQKVWGDGEGVRRGCICDIEPCLVFCPPPEITETMGDRAAKDIVDYQAIPSVYPTNLTTDDGEKITSSQHWFKLFIWDPCQGKGWYFLDAEAHKMDTFYLLRNGSLSVPLSPAPEERLMDFRMYCLRRRANHSTYTPRICMSEAPESEAYSGFENSGKNCVELKGSDPSYSSRMCSVEVWEFGLPMMKYIGGLLSVPFLIATVVVYSVLPELRNTQGATLRCYLCCLIVAYVALAAGRITPSDWSTGPVCLCLGMSQSA